VWKTIEFYINPFDTFVPMVVPPPKFDYNSWSKEYLPAENASRKEWGEFYLREREKWKIGSHGLTGMHYAYLTVIKIKDRTTGQEIHPVWRDVDEIIFGAYEEALKSMSDLIFIKRREVGLTSIFGACIPLINCFIHPGTNQLITSADQKRIADLFKEKVTVAYDGLDERIRPARAAFRMTGTMVFADKDEKTGRMSGLKSSIICAESSKNPKSLEGYGAKSVFLDEFFLHPKPAEVLASTQASVSRGFVKACPIVMGGSCGETSDEGLKKGRELWEDAEHLKIITCFIPGWLGISEAPEYDAEGKETGKILNFCPNGWSDQAGATAWIMQNRKKLSKAKDKSRYVTFIKNYPLTVEEVFTFGAGGILPEEILQKIEEQKVWLHANPPPVMTYRLEDRGGRITAEPDPKGLHYIVELPQPGQVYRAGSDPIAFNSDNIENGSEYVMAIKKPTANTYVHYFAVRSLDADLVVLECIKAQRLFNNAQTMLEMNAGGVAKAKYKEFGCLHLLAKRPNALGIKFVNPDAYGWWRGGGNNPADKAAIEGVVKYLTHHTSCILFKRILDETSRFPHKNTDLLDALMSAELFENNVNELGKIMPRIQPPKMIYTVGRDSSGRTIGKWVATAL
jgi:hypothetical protein